MAVGVFLAQGVSSLESGLRSAARSANLNTAQGGDAIPGLAGTVIGSLLSITAVAFFMLAVYGGFLWMTARGNEDYVTRGKNTIIAATIGLIIIMSAYALTNFVLRSTQGSENSVSSPAAIGAACPPVGSDQECSGKRVGDTCVTNVERVEERCKFIGDPINACRCGGY